MAVNTLLPTLNDLQAYQYEVSPETELQSVVDEFKRTPNLPGVLLIEKSRFVGILTRKQCFEILGRKYGVEIFLRRSVYDIYLHSNHHPIIFPGSLRLDEAVKMALERPLDHIYDPIVVRKSEGGFMLVEMQYLLLEQNQMFEQLYHEVERLSIIDPLTNAFNRRGLASKAQDLLSPGPERSSIAVLMIDADYFKQINDQYGHQTGDLILQAISETCKASIRQQDVFGRYGGDEFLVLIRGEKVAVVRRIAERLSKKIAALNFQLNDTLLHITVSIGVIYSKAQKQPTYEALYTLADKMLYKAKQNGRNCVVIEEIGLEQNTHLAEEHANIMPTGGQRRN